ncbi:MAG: plasmid pRiA4b ORF-3 family protein [Planctomycetes bacterium]|nr:plasmid pRiA4b ORF-3 family protein [Planctomycetota bacterium]
MPKKKKSKKNLVYQIKVSLEGSKPAIWRRFQVSGDDTLSRLHYALQIIMGWKNSHLHQFIIDGKYYGIPDPEGDLSRETIDENTVQIKDVIQTEKTKFIYEYDFGDSWKHILLVEKTLPAEKGVYYPVCLDGEQVCPPEDCGGIWGYADLLKIIRNPDHSEYEEMTEWVGEGFDPEKFDIAAINEAVKNIDKYKEDEDDLEEFM